jgi:hypothetical protein
MSLSTILIAAAAAVWGAQEPRFGCEVLGRVLDDLGQPLAGVGVSLRSVGSVWVYGEEYPARYETRTDTDGRFRLETTLPSADWVSLELVPERFHMRAGRDFGRAGGRNRDPLRAGENDLGDFWLIRTGALTGRVVDAAGAPVPDCFARLHDAHPGGRVLGGTSNDQGRFTIGHVPPGAYRVKVIEEGYLMAVSSEVRVVVEQAQPVPDIVLEVAPTVAGRVVDEQGRPIAGAFVSGWPLRSGRQAWTDTLADGSFIVHLPVREAYKFKFKAEGYVLREGLVLQPGASDEVVALERAETMTFLVVDGDKGGAVERFGLRVARRFGENSSSSVDTDEVPIEDCGGRVTRVADLAKDQISVQAEGYAPLVAHVAPDEVGGSLQTVRLAPAAVLRGRVLHAGLPAPGATVRVERCEVKLDPDEPDLTGEERLFSENYGFDLDRFSGRRRVVLGDGEGCFVLGDLAAGTYTVEVRADVGAPLVRAGVALAEGAALELGDLELPPAGAVEGVVYTNADIPPAGLVVHLDNTWDGLSARVAADGSFRFDGLAAGEHRLIVEDTPGVLARDHRQPFDVGALETRHVVLDLRDAEPLRIRVTVEVNGERATGFAIARGETQDVGELALGLTDDEGRLSVELEPSSNRQFVVRSPAGLRVGRIACQGGSGRGDWHEQTLAFGAGELALQFPDGFEIPKRSKATVFVHGPRSRSSYQWTSLFAPDLEPLGPGLEWTGTRNELGPLALGRYRLRVRVDQLTEHEDIESGVFRQVGSWLVGEVEIAGGEASTCLLKPGTGELPRYR